MRSRWRTLDRQLVRDVLAISVAVGFVGLSFGAIAVASGVPTWAVVAMSIFVFAGGSQFMAVGLLAAGSPVAAIVGGLLLNARHFPFGLAVADVLAGGPIRVRDQSHAGPDRGASRAARGTSAKDAGDGASTVGGADRGVSVVAGDDRGGSARAGGDLGVCAEGDAPAVIGADHGGSAVGGGDHWVSAASDADHGRRAMIGETSAGPRRHWGLRLVGSHLMVDEAVAFALAQPDRPRRVQAYWLTGATLFTLWQFGTWLGIAIGSAVGDPARYGLDAAFPAALLALLLPRLKERAALRVALLGGGLALLASLLPSWVPGLSLPAGLPVLLALLGLLAAGRTPPPGPPSSARVAPGPGPAPGAGPALGSAAPPGSGPAALITAEPSPGAADHGPRVMIDRDGGKA